MVFVEETRRRGRLTVVQKIVLVEAILLDIAPVEEIMYPPLAYRVEVGESSSHHHYSRNLVISSWLGATNRCRNTERRYCR